MASLQFPKPRPAKLDKADRKSARDAKDKAENAKVKARSGGRCEVVDHGRCRRRAVHIHHVLGGFGVRGRGASAIAQNKLHLCVECHSDIHAHVLIKDGERWRRLK